MAVAKFSQNCIPELSVEAGEELRTGASLAASMSGVGGDIRILKIMKRERNIFEENYFNLTKFHC